MKTIIINATAKKLKKLGELKSELSAIDKAIKALQADIGLPKAQDAANALKLQNATDKGTVFLVNGNGDQVGSMSIFWHPGAKIPAGWRARTTL